MTAIQHTFKIICFLTIGACSSMADSYMVNPAAGEAHVLFGGPEVLATSTYTPTATLTQTPTVTVIHTPTETTAATFTPTDTETPTLAPTPNVDVNGDGVIDEKDLLFLMRLWHE